MKKFHLRLAVILLVGVLAFSLVLPASANGAAAPSGLQSANKEKKGICPDCGASFGFRSVYLRINEDINLVYVAKLPAGCTDISATFTICGVRVSVTDYTIDADGNYSFLFTKISPAQMGDNISATLSAKCGGTQLTDTVEQYSIKDYCLRMMSKYPDNPALQTLLSDILTYGAATQNYIGYHTDAPVTAGLDLSPSTFPGVYGKKTGFSGEKSDAADWKSASVILGNDLSVRFGFIAESIDQLSVRVSLDGRTQEYSADDFSANNGKYFIDFDGVKATEFDDTFTAEFYLGGVKTGRTLSYSVNTYICNFHENETASGLQTLLEALYNYGASAASYADGKPSDGTEEETAWIDVITGAVNNEGWQELIP